MSVSNNIGVFQGRVLLQQRGEIGGNRFVFVKLQGGAKNDLVHPSTGMKLLNPFKGNAKFYAGDLVEYKYNDATNGTCGYILKTYEVAKATSASTDTAIYIKRDAYRHIPFVGDILMKAPSTLSGKGAGYALTAVEATTVDSIDVWKVTLNTTLGALAAGDILVEAATSGASVSALVQNPNMVLPCDYDCLYAPASGDSDFDGARYFLTPVLSELAYLNRMSPIPASVKALNSSRVDGWFKL